MSLVYYFFRNAVYYCSYGLDWVRILEKKYGLDWNGSESDLDWIGLGWIKKIGPMSNSDLHIKCSALNVDFNGVRFDPLGSTSPPYECIKFGYPLQNA